MIVGKIGFQGKRQFLVENWRKIGKNSAHNIDP
jgi:hypothetical protein